MAVVAWVVPAEPPVQHAQNRGGLREVLGNRELLRVDLGVFVLHAVQIAMWMSVPALLQEAGLTSAEQWKVYLPAVMASLLVMGGLLFRLERMGYFKQVNFVFLIVGHTKNAADRLFNCLKVQYHRQNIYTMDQLLNVLDDSPKVTVHQATASDFFDWDSYLHLFYSDFKKAGSEG